jgi:signal transduction histidine kinase
MPDETLPPEIQQAENFDLVLLANFVHQVVNPLNGVAGTLDNLVEGVITDEKRRDQRLRAARAHLEQCISLIRNLAYLAPGFHELQKEDTKIIVLPQVIIEAAMFYAEDAENSGIRFELKDRATQNRVAGHPDLIRQVLMNMFDNCKKYSRYDSEVVIRQRIQKGTNNAIITIENQPRVAIDPTDIARLFDLGFRGSNARRIISSGTGLGLYISKKIIEDVHKGSIHIQAERGDRLLFTIRLPRGSEPPLDNSKR